MNKVFKIIFLPFFIATLLYSNPLDMVFHPIQTAKKAAIGAGVVFITKKVGEAAYKEFQAYAEQHPKEAEEYLKNKSEFADGFFRFIDKHRSGIDPKEFDDIDKEIRDRVLALDKSIELLRRKNNERCTILDLNILTLMPSDFDKRINSVLPKITQNIGAALSFGDVDSYYVTTKKKSQHLQRDHIPSFAAIKVFLQKKNINSAGKNKDFIQSNTSTIAVDTDIHEKTETYGGRNTKTRQNADASNLKLASIRDMVFGAALSYKKYGSSGATTYIKSAITLYERNSLLCLYQ